MHVTLTVVAGPHSGREFRFGRPTTFVVGRAPECHFPLADDPFVAPRHLRFEIDPPHCRAVDLETKPGIKVNGKKVVAADLADGDEVRVGQTVLQFALTPAAPLDIPGYRPEREIGQGPQGTVFLARRDVDGVRVAIKTVWPPGGGGDAVAERFRAEVARLEELDHPNLTRVYGGGAAGPLLYVATEFVNGPNAEQIVAARGPMSARAGVLVVARALTGLAYAHARGLTHGGVKASNLLVGTTEKKRVVKVADFGLTRALDVAGGRDPLSDTLADQYAAAATLHVLIAGPVGLDPRPIREVRSDVPAGVAAAIDRALDPDPGARFPDAAAFRQALLDGLAG